MELQELYEQITNNPNKGELYIQMGDEYSKTNINQAYLCYEQASSLCEGDKYSEAINKMNSCRLSKDFYVHPASFVILSYNSKDIMIECLEAIRNTCTKGSYEVIVVDSNSTDGIREWLQEQNDIKLILNDKFDGFAAGCNQGAKIAEVDNDIYLLNNDAIVTPRSLFYMRLALYSNEKIGAVGPVSSNVGEENLYDKVQRSHDEWMILADSINCPSLYPIQYSHWLQGHALLIKRRVWDEAGMMDTDFKADMVLTCPPYYNLEIYSKDQRDLSRQPTYTDFLHKYTNILIKSSKCLVDNSFFVIVVSELRKNSHNIEESQYLGLVPDTIRILRDDCNLSYYNEMILINSIGSLPIRAPRQFARTRKIGRHHQNVLVFYKGNLSEIEKKFGEVSIQ